MADEDTTVHPTVDEMKIAGAIPDQILPPEVLKDTDSTIHPTVAEMRTIGGLPDPVAPPEVKKDEDTTVHPTNDEVKAAAASMQQLSGVQPQQQQAAMQAEPSRRYRTRAHTAES